MGSISKMTKTYSKEEWLSEDGAFLERQLKSLLEDIADGIGELLF